jgi:hypothetical protein
MAPEINKDYFIKWYVIKGKECVYCDGRKLVLEQSLNARDFHVINSLHHEHN